MFDGLKKEIQLAKMKLQLQKGIDDGRIVPFDEEFFKRLRNTYFGGIPVDIHLKYLKAQVEPYRCYDRSLYMFFAIPESTRVIADVKILDLMYGKECAGHSWIELGDYVYDPTQMLRYEKDVYYKMFAPTNISRQSIEDYCAIEKNKEFYESVKSVSLADLKLDGSKILDYCGYIYQVQIAASVSNNPDFVRELNEFLVAIGFDYLKCIQRRDNEIYATIFNQDGGGRK